MRPTLKKNNRYVKTNLYRLLAASSRTQKKVQASSISRSPYALADIKIMI